MAKRVPKGRAPVTRRGKLSRSEIVSVRFDPRSLYLAEIAARRLRRTVSSLVEYAVEDLLSRVPIQSIPDSVSVAYVASEIWDVDPADRLVKLAIRYPDLMTYEEQLVWKLIKENGFLWRGKPDPDTDRWIWTVAEEYLDLERLRAYWDTFNKVARGQADRSQLPSWPRGSGSVESHYGIPAIENPDKED